MIFLGGPVTRPALEPDAWANEVQTLGYRASYSPVDSSANPQIIKDYVQAAHKKGIVIAEVGAWSNPLSSDPKTRDEAIQKCINQLALAETIGARCCVNITGSRGAKWDGPHESNLTPETFDMIVEVTRHIVDTVRPTRTFYVLETMPWMYPDSADHYVRLLDAIGRPTVAAHFDPINLINCVDRYYNNRKLLQECIEKLGSRIKSCHAKDIKIQEKLTLHLDEVRPGLGILDYAYYMKLLSNLPGDIPLMLEHLPNMEEYKLAAEHLRTVAKKEGIAL